MRSLCLLACWAVLWAGAEARVHPTRDQAQARQVVEMRSFDMWALDASEVRIVCLLFRRFVEIEACLFTYNDVLLFAHIFPEGIALRMGLRR